MRSVHFATNSAVAAALLVALCATPLLAQEQIPAEGEAEQAPYGIWINHTGRGAVKIFDCDGNLCGHVVWTKSAEDAEKGCGLEILGNVKPTGPKVWDKGWIYSPERKKRFDVEIRPVTNDKLKLRGYKGIKMLGKTMYWNRAPADLETCAVADDAAPGKSGAAPARTKTGKLDKKPAQKKTKAKALPKLVEPESDGDAGRTPKSRSARQDKEAPGKRTSSSKRYEPDQSGDDRDSPTVAADKGDCRISVPYVDITFPCKKDD